MAGGYAPTRAESDAGFEFAFDNEAFSDKVPRIEVVGSSSDDAPECGTDAASRKRRREEAEGDDGECINSSRTAMGTLILRVNTIKVNSAILAAKSAFFFKLFSNGMKESGERQATLRIADSAVQPNLGNGYYIDFVHYKENAFMELLRFMYSGKLTPTAEPTFLVDILMVADKFEVISCMELCGQQIIDLPMTLESAVLCLDLPSSISVSAALTEAAKKFLAERYKLFLSSTSQDELMRVPLPGIVAILSSNHPRVSSQEDVYDFVLRWADLRYPNSEERRKILSSCLLLLAPQVYSRTNAIQIDQPSCTVYFTLKQDCSRLFPLGSIHSPPFHCAGHGFFLSVHCRMEHLCLVIQKLEDNVPVTEAIDYKIEFKEKSSLKFGTIYMNTAATTDSKETIGCKVPWSKFINGRWFIDGKFHLQVHINRSRSGALGISQCLICSLAD